MELRPYQISAVERLIQAYRLNPLLISVTGSGKTVMLAHFCLYMMAKHNTRILWLAHRRELIMQANKTLQSHGIKSGVILAGEKPNYDETVQVASIQTLGRRLDKIAAPDFIVVDECHHSSAKSYRKIFETFPMAKRVGCSATPMRNDNTSLGDIFGHPVVSATAAQLVEDGYLVNPKIYSWEISKKLLGSKLKKGDIDAALTANVLSDRIIMSNIRKTWISKAWMRKTLCFASTVEHSKEIVKMFNDIKIPAEHLDGETPKAEREATLERLREGHTWIVSNVGLFLEGTDIPDVSCVMFCKLTTSLPLYLQAGGRCMRPSGDMTAVVLDFCGNSLIHGDFVQPREWSLAEGGGCKGPSEALGLKLCHVCFLASSNYQKECPNCGNTFSQRANDLTYKVVKGRLVEYEKPLSVLKKEFWQKGLDHSILLPELIGYYHKRFKEAPLVIGSKLIIPSDATMADKKAVWLNYYEYYQNVRTADREYKKIFGTWARGKNKWYSEYLINQDKKHGII